jgi:hypothetical protein
MTAVDAAPTAENRGRGRGQNYTDTGKPMKSGLCAALGSHVYDYGHSATADQMLRTSWEKLVQHVGTAYGQDISNELTNRMTVTIAEPVYPPAAIARHAIREELVREGQVNMQIA